MKFEALLSYLEEFSFRSPTASTNPEQGRVLYNFVLDKKPSECLELGFAHGVSSCYVAAALDEIGTGHLTSVDLIPAVSWQKPSIEELLLKTGLQEYVTVAREKTSYTWFLKKKIQENSLSNHCQSIYNFCFIDGPKNWTIDSSAFFLVDKLLKQDGWILFDDFDWIYAQSRPVNSGQSHSEGISLFEMGEDELNTPHIELIFRLLVMQHPDYTEFKIQDEKWAWAHKATNSPKKTFSFETSYTYKSLLSRALRKSARGLQQKK